MICDLALREELEFIIVRKADACDEGRERGQPERACEVWKHTASLRDHQQSGTRCSSNFAVHQKHLGSVLKLAVLSPTLRLSRLVNPSLCSYQYTSLSPLL